jgi:cell division protein FtsN
MLIRAVMVLLVVLNLGTAAWWLSRPPAPATVPPVQRAGVPRLKLLSEVAKPVTTAPVAPMVAEVAPPVAVETTEPAKSPVCFSLGPFADRAAADAAVTKLAAKVTRAVPREAPGRAATGYSVSLAPAADRAAAQAAAQRIGAAGFDDFLIVNTGEQANSIALGRYGSRESAERRQSALKAAGFDARIEAIGAEGSAQWWLDASTPTGTAASQLRGIAGAAQSRSLDCTQLR